MKILNKKKIITLLIFFFFILIFILNPKFFLSNYAYFFTIDKFERGADAIVVLSGSPSTRIPKAFDLYNKNYSDTLLLTDPKQLNKDFQFIFYDNLSIAKRIQSENKFNAKIIKVKSSTGGVKSTFDEAKDILKYSKKKKL